MATELRGTLHPVFESITKHYVGSNGYSEITPYERHMYGAECEALENPDAEEEPEVAPTHQVTFLSMAEYEAEQREKLAWAKGLLKAAVAEALDAGLPRLALAIVQATKEAA